MARRKTGRRRGRPRQHHARRRETTRAGRRGEPAIDPGTAELRRHRVRLTTVTDLPADPLGVLLGHGFIDKQQYATGRDVGELLAIAHSGLVAGSGVQTTWLRIIGGLAGGMAVDLSAAAERAWRILGHMRRRIRSEAIADLVFAICDDEWHPCLDWVIAEGPKDPADADSAALTSIATGLDRVARSWSSGRDLAKTA